MKRRIEPSDLDTLMDLTYPLNGYSLVQELPPEREKVQIEVPSPIVHTILTEILDEDNNEDEEEEEETVVEDIPVLLHMSNAHIEAMILQKLGPDSTRVFKEIRMNLDAVAFSNMVLNILI